MIIYCKSPLIPCAKFTVVCLPFDHVIAALQKFSSQVQRYPDGTQYDLVASYCRTSSNCADVLQLLESLAKQSDSDVSVVHNSEKITKSEKVCGYVFVKFAVLKKYFAYHFVKVNHTYNFVFLWLL